MKEKFQKPTGNRDSNIELLRILAMIGVVLLHYNNTTIGGGFAHVAQVSLNHRLLQTVESIFICAVNVFVLITGYYGSNSSRASVAKAGSLLLQVSLFRTVQYTLDVLWGAEFSLTGLLVAMVPCNWFVVLYVALYLLSPYLNRLLERISGKALRNLVILCICLFSVWPVVAKTLQSLLKVTFPGAIPVSLDGDSEGYSLVNFVMLYLIGAWLRKENITVKKRWSGMLFGLCAMLILLVSLWDTTIAWAYNNPLVILEAVAAFLLMRQLPLKSRAVNFLAAGAFTCYLGHSRFFRLLDIPGAVGSTPLLLLLHMLAAGVGIYLCCVVVHLAYSPLSKCLTRMLTWILQKVNLEYIRVELSAGKDPE